MKAKTTLVSFYKEVVYTVYQFVSGYCKCYVVKTDHHYYYGMLSLDGALQTCCIHRHKERVGRWDMPFFSRHNGFFLANVQMYDYNEGGKVQWHNFEIFFIYKVHEENSVLLLSVLTSTFSKLFLAKAILSANQGPILHRGSKSFHLIRAINHL